MDTSHLLSRLAHELRTPLGSLRMLSDLMADSDPGPAVTRHLERVFLVLDDLEVLVNQTSQLAKAGAEPGTGEVEGVALDTFLDSLAESVQPTIEEMSLVLGVEREGLPERWPTHQQDLDRLLRFLLLRACAVNRSGKVVLRVEGTEEGLRFQVEDGGPPLTPEECRKLFEPFASIDPRARRARGGSSLELPIAHRLALRLGGTLEARPLPGGALYQLDL